MDRRWLWVLPVVVIVAAAVAAMSLLLPGPEDARVGSQAAPGPPRRDEPHSASAPETVPSPPAISTPRQKEAFESLLARGDAASKKELANLHFQAGRDLRRAIERRATDRDAGLRGELTAASKTALGGADARRKLVALETLHHLGADESADGAVKLLSPDEPPEVAIAAIAYLGRVNHHEAFAEVLEQARSSRDARVRATAIRNLVLVGGKKHPEEAVPVLESALSSDDVRLQAEALRVLGRFPEHVSPAARRRVKELAEGKGGDREDAEVREAARMLGEHLEALADMPHNTEGSR